MTETQEPKGFRRDIMVLHHLSDLMEKHPHLPRPAVNIGSAYSSTERRARVSWSLWPDWNITCDWGDETYEEYQKRQHELQRVDLEQRITALVTALETQAGGPLDWEKNDPTKDEYYYTLTLPDWNGASLNISTQREAVCEKVTVMETEREEEVPDPAVIEAVTKAAPLVKVTVKDTITEWQCNSALAEKTAPRHIRTVTKTEVGI